MQLVVLRKSKTFQSVRNAQHHRNCPVTRSIFRITLFFLDNKELLMQQSAMADSIESIRMSL